MQKKDGKGKLSFYCIKKSRILSRKKGGNALSNGGSVSCTAAFECMKRGARALDSISNMHDSTIMEMGTLFALLSFSFIGC